MEPLALGAIGLLAGSISVLLFTLAANEPPAPPRLGLRGRQRARVLERSSLFRACEPAIGVAAGWISHVPLAGLRARADTELMYAGDWLGLTPDELLGIMLLSGMTCAGGALLLYLAGAPPIFVWILAGVGTFIPWSSMTAERDRRRKDINRSLPGAIDVAAMCMGAGLDFVGSLQRIIDQAIADDPLTQELGLILRALELGQTRKEALGMMARRVPTDPVKEFANAVIQSEEKGNPLAETLRIQASMLRLRRSIHAEELANRAGALLLLPVALMLLATLVCLVAPMFFRLMSMGDG